MDKLNVPLFRETKAQTDFKKLDKQTAKHG